MIGLFTEMLDEMDAAFREFEAVVPKPVWIEAEKRFRCKEQTIQQALIQKLARIQSALRASLLLYQNGYTMEVGVLHRVIDETNEDVEFLTSAIITTEVTALHERYLRAFWAEEFGDKNDPGRTHQSRDMVRRQGIRAHNARALGKGSDVSEPLVAAKIVNKAFSGFVHGASPHILECFGGNSPHFHTQGLLGTPRMPEYEHSLWNYMYRGFMSHLLVAQAFRAESVSRRLQEEKRRFEAIAGVDYSVRPKNRGVSGR
jgi:hypothetical protein